MSNREREGVLEEILSHLENKVGQGALVICQLGASGGRKPPQTIQNQFKVNMCYFVLFTPLSPVRWRYIRSILNRQRLKFEKANVLKVIRVPL